MGNVGEGGANSSSTLAIGRVLGTSQRQRAVFPRAVFDQFPVGLGESVELRDESRILGRKPKKVVSGLGLDKTWLGIPWGRWEKGNPRPDSSERPAAEANPLVAKVPIVD